MRLMLVRSETLRNRLAMAPMTRSRATAADGTATDMMATYYGQRAGAAHHQRRDPALGRRPGLHQHPRPALGRAGRILEACHDGSARERWSDLRTPWRLLAATAARPTLVRSIIVSRSSRPNAAIIINMAAPMGPVVSRPSVRERKPAPGFWLCRFFRFCCVGHELVNACRVRLGGFERVGVL